MTPALVDSLLAGKIYVNFHTATNPSGEIRGQLEFPTSGVTSVTRSDVELPGALVLQQNYPNPFNPRTAITFQVAEAGPVELTVFNLLGQHVARLVNEAKPAGTYTVTFDGNSHASGVYMYELRDGRGQMQVKRMVLVK